MHIISKEFHFSASHVLLGLAGGHPCGRIHGHNYILRVFLQGPLNVHGFVVDYRSLEPIKNYVAEELDHRHLNDVLPMQPTVENMSRYIYEKFAEMFPEMVAVEISETPKTCCRYEP